MTFGMISIAETTTDIITLDTPIEELNDLTLNEVFKDSQLVINNDFSDGSSNWSKLGTDNTISFSNNQLIFNGSVTANGGRVQIVTSDNAVYYINYNYNFISGDNAQLLITTPNGATTFESLSLDSNDGFHSYRRFSSVGIRLYFRQSLPFTYNNLSIDYINLYNLTSLGIDTLTQQQLDDYYNIYMNGGYYEYDAVLNDLDMTDFIIISSSFVLWLWFMRFVKGVL
jgi:hypothetical protein